MQGGFKDATLQHNLALCSKHVAVQAQKRAIATWLSMTLFQASCSLAPEHSANHELLQRGPRLPQFLGCSSCGFYKGP